MFHKKVKDSIAIAKQIKIAERTLHKDRKRALFVLLLEVMALVGLLIVQCVNTADFETAGDVLVIIVVRNSSTGNKLKR